MEDKYFWPLYCRMRIFVFRTEGHLKQYLFVRSTVSQVLSCGRQLTEFLVSQGFIYLVLVLVSSSNSKRAWMVTIWFTLISATSFVVVMAAVSFSNFRNEKVTSVSSASSISVFLFTQMTNLSVCMVRSFQPCFQIVACVFFFLAKSTQLSPKNYVSAP